MKGRPQKRNMENFMRIKEVKYECFKKHTLTSNGSQSLLHNMEIH